MPREPRRQNPAKVVVGDEDTASEQTGIDAAMQAELLYIAGILRTFAASGGRFAAALQAAANLVGFAAEDAGQQAVGQTDIAATVH